jgi:ABC-type branched-subunit amino acid transport system ATPase component
VTSAAILTCSEVEVAYDKVKVLFGVDLEVHQGEIVALLGTNGSGKSTLLKAISGLVDPFCGEIIFDGVNITHSSPVEIARLGIVHVPGGKAVFPTLTVAEHFKAAAWLYAKEPVEVIAARIEYVLDLFPRLRERLHGIAGNLSGGEQQQLGLGMAFVAKPKLLVIDELSLGLAPSVVERLLRVVREIHAGGCSVLIVEQSVNVALTIADRAYFLEKGEVRFSGPTADLLDREDVLRSVFLEGAASGGSHGSLSTAGHTPTRSSSPKSHQPVVLAVEALSKRFGGILAVDEVSFGLKQGQIVGLIGPNGAGKTTIFDMISGIVQADGGSVKFQGVEVTGWSPNRRAAFGLGRSFQDARLFPSLTVSESIAIGFDRHVPVRDHLAALLNLPAVQESELQVVGKVDELIDLMNLGPFRDKFISELSTGSRRVVDLAMVIAHGPSVLLLDEPSSGIAQRETESLGRLLLRIKDETKCSMLVVEHDMALISSISDRLVALELGAVLTVGSPEEVIKDPRVIACYLGGDTALIQRSDHSASRAQRSNADRA